MADLVQLANLIRRGNHIDHELAGIIGRPPHPGHIAEYVAAAIFGIDLHASANSKASDGRFRAGPLAGRSVNIKYGSRRNGTLNLVMSSDPLDHPDVYLVLTGPAAGAISSRGAVAPWVIHAAYLFVSRDLLATLAVRGIQPGTAASVRREQWEAAMIYPEAQNSQLNLTEAQRAE